MWRPFAEGQLAQAADVREARVAANRVLDMGEVLLTNGSQ